MIYEHARGYVYRFVAAVVISIVMIKRRIITSCSERIDAPLDVKSSQTRTEFL